MVKNYVTPQVRIMSIETAYGTLVDFSNGESVTDKNKENFEVGAKGNEIDNDMWQDEDN